MLQVKTRTGVHSVPTNVSERAKWWAETLHDVTRLEEIHGLLELMRREAYQDGQASALGHFMVGFAKQKGDVVDVEWKEVEESTQGDLEEGAASPGEPEGSEHPESAAVSQADGSA